MFYLEEAGMIAQVRDTIGGIRGLGKVDKVYLDNTNLIVNLAREYANIGTMHETFFYNQLRVKHKPTTSEAADFKIDDMDFEVGGKTKGARQIREVEKGFIVKDNIETAYLNTIPLWHFGLMY